MTTRFFPRLSPDVIDPDLPPGTIGLRGDDGVISVLRLDPSPVEAVTFQPWEAMELTLEAVEVALVASDFPGKHYALDQIGRARELLRADDAVAEEFTNDDDCCFG